MSSNICQELLTAMIEQPVFSIAAQSSRVSDGPLPTQKTVLVALGGMFILSCKFSLQASIHFSDYRVTTASVSCSLRGMTDASDS